MVRAAVLPVDDELYGVEAGRVCEVMAPTSHAPLPNVPAALLGVINRRGEVLPLYDTAGLVRGGGTSSETKFYAIVDSYAGRIALLVTESPWLADLDESAGDSEVPGARGRYLHGESVVTLLDVDVILRGLLEGTAS